MMKHILLLCVLVSIPKIITFKFKYELSVGILQVSSALSSAIKDIMLLSYYTVFYFQFSSALSSAIKEAQVGIDCPMQVFF